jgi:hypothetical protein
MVLSEQLGTQKKQGKIMMMMWPIYCLTSLLHLHTLYIDFSIVLLTVLITSVVGIRPRCSVVGVHFEFI